MPQVGSSSTGRLSLEEDSSSTYTGEGLSKTAAAQAARGAATYEGPHSPSLEVFSRQATAAALTQRLRARFPLFLSEFPIELRQYPKGAAMPWHKDEQMFASPQWEIIYTIDNSSDSTTEWRDESGKEHSLWTEPNSLLAVEAEGWEHRVLPVRKGVRTILKLAFTSSRSKLPAFDANLGREAYAA
ncbi:hypothetical protein OEZ86_009525 [Tetradesmus obliquus]|uniref:Fe2OG dioxygenase domain-containing protein n=1 Tax=Tetradesmus obliquus TaxID=3088 RepID=A0ABY8USJ4_TETOB|nr:hypothetical protein OEZ85_000971 [Tetradesmus obliquus]WIA42987.1 hypothetical protein OEZ86_009525 [Tetradesmus obliquus]